MKNNSSLLFSVFSFVFLLLIIWFVSIGGSEETWNEKIDSLVQHWNSPNSHSTIWKLEALVVVGIAWVSFNLSSLTKWWNLIGIGHLLMLSEYIFMLGGYKEVASEEAYLMLNGMAKWTFVTSNMIWTLGMVGVFSTERKYTRIIGVILAGIPFILIGTIYFGFASFEQLASIAMPAVLALYLFNIYYGYYLYNKSKAPIN